jgi:hypothetical protein
MSTIEMPYEQLPSAVKDMLTPDQWQEERGGAIDKNESVPSSGVYINLQDGQRREFKEGDPAPAPLLPAPDFAGASGQPGTGTRTQPAADPRSRTWGE